MYIEIYGLTKLGIGRVYDSFTSHKEYHLKLE